VRHKQYLEKKCLGFHNITA